VCGRFALNAKTDELIAAFVADGGDFAQWTPQWNIHPTDTIPIIVESTKTAARRMVVPARWSLVPPWSKELALKYPTFNARSETVAEKPSFRGSVGSKRAIIPASGYYEWHTEGKVKTPHYLHPDSGFLAFAALYSWWRPEAPTGADSATDGAWVLTTTMLTMDSVPALAGIHDRNPVMLPRDWWDDWLAPEVPGDQAFVDAAVAASIPVAASLRHHPVAPLRGDGPQLIVPLAP
jgi:putative SOS response-associated peptidase YedK